MMSIKSIISLTFVVLLIFTISSSVDAAFKKLPMNGSMFGKRGTSIEYESTAQKALTAMCEVCQSWFNQDNYVN
ncbi:CLUMA_CG016370, isoform A [Clunio marinus]|uniref:CLUMA_CG016370, isoform A n=1 Tax=Clunio marinus TaxID=568069 RepID=A0A1J1IWY1_9DIPT|nr:CLUMA_CG016370, isoform A [Clunio marinus]